LDTLLRRLVSDRRSEPIAQRLVNERILSHRDQLHPLDSSENVDVVFAVGAYTFYPAAKSLRKREVGVRLCLTSKEARLLEVLCQAGMRAVPWWTLKDEVWGDNVAASKHALQTHIYRLRQALEADPRDPRLLVTMPEGYRLDGVRRGKPAYQGDSLPKQRSSIVTARLPSPRRS
jgi:DNA-binding response OmpR family regulator